MYAISNLNYKLAHKVHHNSSLRRLDVFVRYTIEYSTPFLKVIVCIVTARAAIVQMPLLHARFTYTGSASMAHPILHHGLEKSVQLYALRLINTTHVEHSVIKHSRKDECTCRILKTSSN